MTKKEEELYELTGSDFEKILGGNNVKELIDTPPMHTLYSV